MAAIGTAEMAGALDGLAAPGLPVCVHASLRSFGTLAAGPDTVIDAVLAVGATLVVPTASFRSCLAPRPEGVSRPFNAEGDGSIPDRYPAHRWDPGADFVDPAMGALPAAVLRRPDRVRGDHPLSSFAALGPLAATIVAGQRPLDVYAPMRALADRGGLVIGMGVGLTTITLLHLAERAAGLRLLRRWALGASGVVECEHGGCSRGFERLAASVADVETAVQVGTSGWRVWPAADLLDRATAALRNDPSAATCAVPGCARCRDLVAAARAGYRYPPEDS
jgi:aminoglycoside 3-N-acetyltransferase